MYCYQILVDNQQHVLFEVTRKPFNKNARRILHLTLRFLFDNLRFLEGISYPMQGNSLSVTFLNVYMYIL